MLALIYMSPKSQQELSIFNSPDYRDFLKAKFWELKKTRPTISYRQFSEKYDISISYLKLVLTKKRHLSSDKISAVAKYFELTHGERNYLTFLILKEQSTEPSICEYFDVILTSLKHKNQYLAQHEKEKLTLICTS